MRRLFIVWFLLQIVAGQEVYAQSGSTGGGASGFNPLQPPALPQAPNSAMLGRFGDYQVNLFSGLPEISIPLYTIKTPAFEVPITLSYHASGNKVHDFPSFVGLGWALNAGGEVRRKLVGKPDEWSTGFLYGNPKRAENIGPYTGANNDYEFINNLDNGYVDCGADLFSYNFPAGSGKFFFDRDNILNPVSIPFSPNRISASYIPGNNASLTFDITDPRGNKYQFGKTYTELSTSAGTDGSSSYNTTAWMLEKMMAPDKSDSIIFNYVANGNYTPISRTDVWTVDDLVSNRADAFQFNGDAFIANTGTYNSTHSSVLCGAYINNTIFFRNGKIVFELSAQNREDFGQNFGLSGNCKSLQKIKIYAFREGLYTLIREIEFVYAYFGSTDDKRLKLSALNFKDAGSTAVEHYAFTYNEAVLLPVVDFSTTSIDYWGYYNGKNNNTLVPQTVVTDYIESNPVPPQGHVSTGQTTPVSITIGSTTPNGREPDNDKMQACILKRIDFPTGGYTSFEYEANRYLDASNNSKLAGGLRVTRITSSADPNVQPLIKIYKYGQNESGFGRPNFYTGDYFFYDAQRANNWQYLKDQYGDPIGSAALFFSQKRRRTYYCNPTVSVVPEDAAPVVYEWVTEYTGTVQGTQGKTIHHFRDYPDDLRVMGGSINGLNSTKAQVISKHYNRGQLLSSTVLRKTTSGDFWPVQKTINTYNESSFAETAVFGGLLFKKQISNEGIDGYGRSNDDFYFNNYFYTADDNYLTSTTLKSYSQQDTTQYSVTATTYQRNNLLHQQPSVISTTNSKGLSEILYTAYSGDFAAGIYATMRDKHMVALEVEKNLLLNRPVPVVTRALFTDYVQYPNDVIKPSRQLSFSEPVQYASFTPFSAATNSTDSHYQLLIGMDAYDDRGNVLQLHNRSNMPNAFIWGHDSSMIIAEAKNATATDIAYTSFEEGGKGNFSYGGTPVTAAGAVTGSRIYQLDYNAIGKSSLNSSKTYVVSYWSNNGSYTVFGSTLVRTGPSRNGWTLYLHEVSGVTSTTISGSGAIDELRLYPKDALMTTYTYQPLVGLTSQADANGRLSFFEYDAYGRLNLVRDQDGNILQKYCYNYSGQVTPCSEQISLPPAPPTPPVTPNCTAANCTGEGKRCINDVCETGVRHNIATVRINSTTWQCTYYYSFSDGSVMGDFTDTSADPCLVE